MIASGTDFRSDFGAQDRLQRPPRWPRQPQEAPRRPPRGPKTAQDRPKTPPRPPQEASKKRIPGPLVWYWPPGASKTPPGTPPRPIFGRFWTPWDPSKTNFWSILDRFFGPLGPLSLSLSLSIFLSFFSSIIIASNVVIINQTRGGSVQCSLPLTVG